MGADADVKLTSSPTQAVGLLVVLADSGNVMLHAFGKQELWRHVLDSRTSLASNPDLNGIRSESSVQTMDVERQASGRSPLEDSKARVKKVRFAPDVIEHGGGGSCVNHGKNKGNLMAKKTTCAVKKEHKEVWHDTHVDRRAGLSKRAPADTSCKAQDLAKPYLPVNRMLLYKGKQLYREMVVDDL